MSPFPLVLPIDLLLDTNLHGFILSNYSQIVDMNSTSNIPSGVRLIIGIDFGTTYSAVSYALHECTIDQDKSTVALNNTTIRPVQFGFRESQEKTQIAWHAAKQNYVWGNDVDLRVRNKEISGNDRIVMLKLGLDKSDATIEIRARQAEQLSRIPPAHWGEDSNRRQPRIEDLISIYLRRLFEHAKNKIMKSYGALIGGNIFDITNIQCAICVPAMWTPEMDQVMVTAAEQAGIPNPDLVSESEAAAAFIMSEQQRNAPTPLESALGMSRSIKPHVSQTS